MTMAQKHGTDGTCGDVGVRGSGTGLPDTPIWIILIRSVELTIIIVGVEYDKPA